MASLINAVKIFFEKHATHKRVFVAFSGGLDSSVLLHLCAQFPFSVKAIHVHHGLSKHADDWLKHCEKVCEDAQIELITKKINVTPFAGESLEEMAREKRYAIFSEIIAEEDILLTAHHQNDQAETLLLQLFRGSGPRGLSAMPAFKSFGKGFQGRPLLNFSRKEIEDYAKTHQLKWIEDESNHETKFSRNFIRHSVMPLLASRWPTIQNTLARSAEHCGDTQQLLDEFILKELKNFRGTRDNTLSIKKLLSIDEAYQFQILRQWISREQFGLPSTLKMQHIIKNILAAREDRCPMISIDDYEIRRYRDDLYIMKKELAPTADIFEWNFKEMLHLNEIALSAEKAHGEGLCASIQQVTVCFRKGGETIQLPGRDHHHDLKKLFQSWHVPTWIRDKTPLIYVEGELAAVVGFCVAEKFLAKEAGWKITATQRAAAF